MGLGDMTFRKPTGRAFSDDTTVRGEPCIRVRRLTALAVAAGVLLLLAAPGPAKEKQPQSRTVSGTVFDEAENPIKGATVELTDLQTGKVLDIYSQEQGNYQFTDLRFDHDYTVKAIYQNASSEVRQVSSLDTRTRPVMNLTVTKTKK